MKIIPKINLTMAMSVTYTNVLGQVLFEDRGGNQTEFIPDPLGNVVKCRNSGISYSYSAEYWPYGEIQTSSGTNPSNFGYVGTWGYYKDISNQIYVRARYYKPVQARWSTVDPLWPRENAYGYVLNHPCGLVDYFGKKPHGIPIKTRRCNAIEIPPCDYICHHEYIDDLRDCWKKGGLPIIGGIRVGICRWKAYRDLISCIDCCVQYGADHSRDSNIDAIRECMGNGFDIGDVSDAIDDWNNGDKDTWGQ